MAYKEYQSADIARAALRMSLTETRADENALKERLAKDGIRAVAVNFGGKFLDILPKIFESAIVAAQRQKVISDTHVGDADKSSQTMDSRLLKGWKSKWKSKMSKFQLV